MRIPETIGRFAEPKNPEFSTTVSAEELLVLTDRGIPTIP
jgi:hypothetical protein